MADANLAKMRDTELLKLFAITSTDTLTRRAKQIIAELHGAAISTIWSVTTW